MDYITLALPFNASGDVARRLIATAKLFRLVVLKTFNEFLSNGEPPLSQFSMYKRYRKVGYEILPNRRYVDGAIDLVYGVIEWLPVLHIRDILETMSTCFSLSASRISTSRGATSTGTT